MQRGPIKAQTLQLLCERGVPVRTILDVGVLDRTPELIEAFPDARHVLFEPVAEWGDYIHLAYADMDYKLVQAAVGAKNGSVNIATLTLFDDQAITHIEVASSANAPGAREVPLVTLDDVLAREPETGPFLLKIDVDGEEMAVLEGAKRTLPQCSVVIVEVPRTEFTQRIKLVEDAGFTLFDLTEPCYYDKAFWQCDAVLVRSDLLDTSFKRLTNEDFEPALYETFKDF